MKTSICILISVALSIMSAISAPTPNIKVSSAETHAGLDFSMLITVENAADACLGSFNIKYDKLLLEVLDCSKGDAQTKINLNINTQYAEDIIRVNWSGTTPLKDGSLLILRFKALQKGQCNVSIEGLKLSTVNAVPITANIENGIVTILTDEILSAGEYMLKDSTEEIAYKLTPGTHSLSVDVLNKTKSDESVILMLAFYAQNKTMMKVLTKTEYMEPNAGTDILLEFTVTAETAYVRAFVWEAKRFMPLREDITYSR